VLVILDCRIVSIIVNKTYSLEISHLIKFDLVIYYVSRITKRGLYISILVSFCKAIYWPE
jgi:hypothetical protein